MNNTASHNTINNQSAVLKAVGLVDCGLLNEPVDVRFSIEKSSILTVLFNRHIRFLVFRLPNIAVIGSGNGGDYKKIEEQKTQINA
jgi:hypothetical protein